MAGHRNNNITGWLLNVCHAEFKDIKFCYMQGYNWGKESFGIVEVQ